MLVHRIFLGNPSRKYKNLNSERATGTNILHLPHDTTFSPASCPGGHRCCSSVKTGTTKLAAFAEHPGRINLLRSGCTCYLGDTEKLINVPRLCRSRCSYRNNRRRNVAVLSCWRRRCCGCNGDLHWCGLVISNLANSSAVRAYRSLSFSAKLP